jgi:ATP-dependent Clp protease ATP-binding subunit ClpC
MAAEQTIQLDRYSTDAKSLVAGAQALADERRHAQVEPIHLLARALERDRGVQEVFRRAGANPAEANLEVESALARTAKGNGGLAYLSGAMLQLLGRAEKEAGAGPIEVEHLLNALTQELRGPGAVVLQALGLGPGSLRPHMAALKSTSQEGAGPSGAGGDALARFTHDLVERARRGTLDPVIGREVEVRRLLQILERRQKNHPLLIGEAGIGKTAIVRALATRIASGDVPASLGKLSVLELETGQLLAGAKLRGEIEERLRIVLAAIAATARDTLLFVGGIDSLLGQGSVGGGVADLLKPVLARGEVRLLASTTIEGARKLQERDPALLRRFTAFAIEPPTLDEAIAILKGVSPLYEKHHGVRVGGEALVAAVRLAARYLQDRALPDAAIDLLDETCARKRVELEPKASQSAEKTAPEAAPGAVGEEDLAVVLGEWTGIPVSKMLEAESDKLLKMEARLSARVVGQDEAVRAVSRAVRRGRVGLRDPGKPIGSFLLLGPSGVGKTELAKALAEFLFDDEQSLTRLDMSEFMEKHMAARLVGSPPGYVDSEEGGFLTEAVRRRPYSVLLFDEIEKAHTDVFNLLLQVLDDGRLTDARGRTANFSNTVVIMTSNIGSARLLDTDPRLFETHEGLEALGAVMRDELKAFLRPEFLNRIDDVVLFRPLSKADLRGIVDIQLRHLDKLTADRGLRVELSDEAKNRLVELGYEPAFGARPLKRALLRQVQDPLAEEILRGGYSPGSVVKVDLAGDAFTFAKGT